MNDKFYNLTQEKQQKILNAAFKIFSQNEYKKAPMSEIAAEGGISKALLFHYFHNKKELYLYLWEYAMKRTIEATREYKVTETKDFFVMLERSLFAKCALLRKYPYVYAFSLKAYYEREEEIKQCVMESFSQVSQSSEDKIWSLIDTKCFRPDIDLQMMYKEILLAVDGYMFQKYHMESIDADEIERDFIELIAHWKKIYLKDSEIVNKGGIRK